MTNINSAKTYLKAPETSITVIIDYLIALCPIVFWSVIRYKFEALGLIFVSVITAIITETAYDSLYGKKLCLPKLYTVYCGILFALTLYPSTSLFIAAAGGMLIPLLIKVFSQNGKCIFFAPLVAREIAFLLLPYRINVPEDTPYESILNGIIPAETPLELVLGTTEGVIGSISVIAVILGGIYLAIRKACEFKVALTYISASILLTFIFPLIEARGVESSLYELLSGEVLFIAFFSLSDMPCMPCSSIEKYIKGVLCAGITLLLTRVELSTNPFFVAIILSETIMPIFNIIINKILSAKESKNAE